MTKIDIVITWVDGSDFEWINNRSHYSGEVTSVESSNPARYRDWGTLKFVLRSIEQNMTWVNKIYLVTAGQYPKWLKEQDKVIVIDHKEIIPTEYLPTFSSHVIECFLYKIPKLSEKFIYFNDDTLILRKSKSTDFFINDKPCDFATLHIHSVKKSLMIHQIATNDMAIINEYFEISEVLKHHYKKWFNIKYGLSRVLKTMILSRTPRFPGIEQSHMPQPYLKKTFQEVWARESEVLAETASNRFRHKNDINQWLFRNWQLVSGNFTPVSQKNRSLMIDFEKQGEMEALELCERELQSKKYLMICINDGDDITNQELIVSRVSTALEKAFPKKAAWEK